MKEAVFKQQMSLLFQMLFQRGRDMYVFEFEVYLCMSYSNHQISVFAMRNDYKNICLTVFFVLCKRLFPFH
jgi:hypothetical protein